MLTEQALQTNRKRASVMWAHLQDMQIEFALYGSESQKHIVAAAQHAIAALQAEIVAEIAKVEWSKHYQIPQVEQEQPELNDK